MPVKVSVSVPSMLAAATGGRRELSVEAETVAGAIRALVDGHPLLRVHLFDEAGEIRRHVHLFYNDHNTAWLDDLEIPLRQGDTLTVLQAVSGGCGAAASLLSAVVQSAILGAMEK